MSSFGKSGSLQKLIQKVASFTPLKQRPDVAHDSAAGDISLEYLGSSTAYKSGAMADQEEDYSSLPLVDRFVHKASISPLPRLASRVPPSPVADS